MKTAEIVAGILGTLVFVVGLVIACLPSAIVRDLVKRVSGSKPQ